MKRILVGFALMLPIAACTESGAGATSDCTTTVRFDDRVYQQNGWVDEVGEPLGEADLAACEDAGPNARGPYFPDNPKKVAVWSIPGKQQGNILAVRYSANTYRVMEFTGTE
jgi:hypothetical protein